LNLTLRQRRSLENICETFLPRAEGWPSALNLEIPEAVANAMDFNPRSKDRTQILQLLDFWDSNLHSFLTIGKLKPFSALSQLIAFAFCFPGPIAASASAAPPFKRFEKRWGFST
jgi:hypothetical protein